MLVSCLHLSVDKNFLGKDGKDVASQKKSIG